MSRPIVFLGPTLPLDEARAVLDADYRPPVRRGQLLEAAREEPPLVGVIDGVFLHALAPSPREFLVALELGAVVLGASSLGALRAVELDAFGMEGVGQVYEWFREGKLIADDEVAVVFSAETLEPLSEPLVNIRYGLDAAARAGVLTRAEARRLVKIAKSTYFPQRSWRQLFGDAGAGFSRAQLERLGGFLEEFDSNVKASDARLLLRTVVQRLGRA